MNRDDQDKIFSYLIASARGCIEEPPLYGPLRLLDAYSMLLGMMKPEETDEFYFKLDRQIGEFKDKCMSDEKKFIDGLDQVLESLTAYVISK